MSEVEKILIVGPSWVGDMVMAQSLFITLKRMRPGVVLDVMAPAWSFPLLERMPEVRQGIPMPVGHGSLQLGVRRALGRSLAAEGYTQAIVLPNSLKSALVPWFAAIPQRTGWRGEMRYGLLNDLRKLDKAAFPLMIDRFNALAFARRSLYSAADFTTELPAPALVVDQANASAAREKFALEDSLPILALCPGAEFGEAKRWPEAQYAQVAAEKISQGWQVWLFGSEKDRAGCSLIRDSLPAEQQVQCHNLAGRTSLAEAIDLLSVVDAVVSNDSGLMHISAALERPLVVVYGSTSPRFTPPLNRRKRIVSLGLDCSPCFKRECPLGHTNCLKLLDAEQVLQALSELESEA